MIPFDLQYLWPEAIYLAAFSLILLFAFWRFSDYIAAMLSEAEFSIIVPRSKSLFWIKACLFCIAWNCGVAALMQPIGNAHYPEGAMPIKTGSNTPLQLRRKAHDVILLIDASASMGIKDARQGKSRLEYAKVIGDEVIANLTGETSALYAFTAMPVELSPPTMDSLFVRLMIAGIGINEGGLAGTNIIETMTTIKKKYFSHLSSKLKSIILLSDGGDTYIESLAADQKTKAISTLLNLFNDAKEQHLRIFTIGLGTIQGGVVPDILYKGQPVESKLEEALLRQIAEKGRGVYYAANAYTPLTLSAELIKKIKQDPQYYDENQEMAEGSLLQSMIRGSGIVHDLYYQIPLGIALLLLSLVYFMPDSRQKQMNL